MHFAALPKHRTKAMVMMLLWLIPMRAERVATQAVLVDMQLHKNTIISGMSIVHRDTRGGTVRQHARIVHPLQRTTYRKHCSHP